MDTVPVTSAVTFALKLVAENPTGLNSRRYAPVVANSDRSRSQLVLQTNAQIPSEVPSALRKVTVSDGVGGPVFGVNVSAVMARPYSAPACAVKLKRAFCPALRFTGVLLFTVNVPVAYDFSCRLDVPVFSPATLNRTVYVPVL